MRASTSSPAHFAENLPGIHVHFGLILIAAAAFTALWGALLGAPTLRLRGDYLAIVTLAFGEIVPRVFENFEGISNGRQGITPVDKIALLPGRSRSPTRSSSSPSTTWRWRWCCSCCSSTGACGTPAWAARGSPCARTRSPPRRWASTSCGRSSGPTPSARRSAGSPAPSSPPTRTRSTSTSSSSASRSSSSAWSSSAGWATSGASSSAPSPCRWSTGTCCASSTGCRTRSAWTSTSRRSTSACSGSSSS